MLVAYDCRAFGVSNYKQKAAALSHATKFAVIKNFLCQRLNPFEYQ